MTLTPSQLKSDLVLYRAAMTPAKRQASRRRRPHAAPYPLAVERAYARYVRDLRKDLMAEIYHVLAPVLIRWAPVKLDSLDGDLADAMRQLEEYIELQYGTTYLAGSLGSFIEQIAEAVLGRQSGFFQQEIKAVAGIPLSVDAPWWPEAKALWEQQSFSLIKGASQQHIRLLNTTIIDALRDGLSFDEIVAKIEMISKNFVGWRSNLLARDQIGKLNGLITKNQFQSIGMEAYYWMTSNDERVRGNPTGKYPKAIPSHWIMHGVLCAWNNAGVYYDTESRKWVQKTAKMEMTHPGFAIACRCTAAPSWERYLYDIDREMAA